MMRPASGLVAVQRRRAATFWAARSGSERRMLSIATALLAVVIVWWAGLSPALGTLRGARAEHRLLDEQLQSMRALAVEAAGLQALPRLSAEDSVRALEAATTKLGPTARMSVAGDRVTLLLNNTPADALAQWLVQARTAARALPAEMHLRLNANRNGWDGSVVLALPPT